MSVAYISVYGTASCICLQGCIICHQKDVKEVQSKVTSLQQQLHDLQQEEEGSSPACGLIKQVKTLQVD